MRPLAVTPLEAWIAGRLRLPAGTRPTAEVLEAFHLAALRQTVARVRAASPFYRRLLANSGPEALDDLEAFGRIPLTTADDLRQDPFAFLCLSQSAVARTVTLQTSGTTRAPKRIFFSDTDLEQTIDFFRCGMTTLVSPGDRVLILLPARRPDSVGDLLRRALSHMNIEVWLPDPDANADGIVRRIAEKPVDAIVGMPLQVLALARRAGVPPVAGPHSVLLTGDYTPRAVPDVLRSTWGCKVLQHYGMTETGLGGGVECAAMDGCHLREADLFVEIIDPETGKRLPAGETGEVVVTTLTREAMPLVRYRTGDLARFIDDPCPCGSVLRRLAPVQGRLAYRLSPAAGLYLTLADIDEAVLPLPAVVGLEAWIQKDGDADRLHLVVEASCGNGVKSLADLVENAVMQIPALAAGTLAMAPVIVREPAAGALGDMKKRNLIDRRSDDQPRNMLQETTPFF